MLDAEQGAVNDAERRRWNDQRWTTSWRRREALTDVATPYLLEVLAPRAGERVLDIGSGGGRTALVAASATGPGGCVVGVDVSRPLTEWARHRATRTGSHLSYVVADAQTDHIDGGPFDAAMSQFGVMFFDQRRLAFTNIASHLRPGGRFVFVCWTSLARNPWHAAAALAGIVGPPTPSPPGTSPTGPFVLGDAAETTALLETSGFTGVTHTVHDVRATLAASAVYDEDLLDLLGVPDSRFDEARAAIDAQLSRFQVGVDQYDFPLSFLVFRAHIASSSA